ncbi:MAG: preterminal protein [psittacine adenovirus 7]|uniref:Preterminal protein n=1 Tax=psittacine adenovirus 7 TaxID=2848040 RepID=A0A6B9LKU9_9ADEN|nr:MAG: preterminal protein [psittacine adenovirus 7]QHB43553.1 MAG: preterminal protein [psittacine adenovirus 7]
MSFFQIQVYARLTNQDEETIRFMHLTQYTDQVNIPEFLRTVRGVTWCSRYFNYQIKMLENLAPNSPAVQDHPFNGLPPPHLLIGYAYLFNVNNNYHFTQRTYTKLTYESDTGTGRRPRNFWSILSDCSYRVDTSNVRRLSGPNFEENFLRVQEDTLANRITADMQARENLQGSGITLQPEAIENLNLQEALNQQHIKNLNDFLSGPNFAMKLRYEYETEKDVCTQKCINQILKIITNFIYDWFFNPEKEHLPWQDNWLQQLKTRYNQWRSEKNPQYIFCFISALNAQHQPYDTWIKELTGGARLRSGTRTDLPYQLRQRENQRAITDQMRRNRGQIVQSFIDSLPLLRRIRRPPEFPPEIPESPGEGPSGIAEEEEEEQIILGNEILRILQLVLNELRLELSETARQHEIFSFGDRFYNILQTANEENRITEDYLRRFFFYFFIMEHISSTLFYYHALLNLHVQFRRYVTFNYIQVIITGRDETGATNLHRVWTNHNVSPFLRIFRHILNDILLICDRPSDQAITPFEEENILSSLLPRPESGDPNDVLNQVRLREETISNVTISFKLRPLGLVTTATNRTVIRNASAVRSQEMRRLQQPR